VNKYEKLLKIKDEGKFKLLTGVTKTLFNEMLNTLKEEYSSIHRKGGKPGLDIGLKLVIALEYWREYRGMRQMAFDYDIPLSTLCESILWVENNLSKSPKFQLEDIKNKFKPKEEDNVPIEVILIDVEEQPIERPKDNEKQKEKYSGKKNDIQ
jgi:hypothetical protein